MDLIIIAISYKNYIILTNCSMKNIKIYTIEELIKIMSEMGHEKYRAQQLFKWLWQRHSLKFDSMSDLSKNFRSFLSEKFTILDLDLITVQKAMDGAKKFVLRTPVDHHCLESVYIPEGDRHTVCVSSQIGCPLKCKFCATGLMRFERNLSAFEIANQVQVIQSVLDRRISNIVFMGMGEPLLNLEALFKALEIITSPNGLAVAQRHITISTIGLINGIEELSRSKYKVKLAISLNFADESIRNDMMPATRNSTIHDLLKIARAYSKSKSMITFEYVLIKNINDRAADAERLKTLLKGIRCKLNIIPFNEYPGLPFKKPDETIIKNFYETMLDSKFTVTLRRSKGSDILAACGQLATTKRPR